MLTCSLCPSKAHYRDRRTGQYLCLEHSRLEVVAMESAASRPPLLIRAAVEADYPRIRELSLHFWDETEVDCFDRQYDVLACPALVAFTDAGGDVGPQAPAPPVVGLASYAHEPDWDALVLIMLNVLPEHQGRGGAWALLDALRGEAVRRGVSRILVVTSNDDLPALSLYQRYGYRILDVIPGRISDHHGAEEPGFDGIPVRDEVRLVYDLAP